jgi:hypothetical protein
LLAACAGPGLSIDTGAQDTPLYVDGEHVGDGAVTLPFRYYGTAAIVAVPARKSPQQDAPAPVRTLARTEPPAPQWLFPLDFFVEVVRRRFASAPPVAVDVVLPTPATTLTLGLHPARLAELRARAAAAQAER